MEEKGVGRMKKEVKLTSSQIDDLIQELQGTIKSFDSVVEEMFGVGGMDLHMETLQEFDQHLFCCDSCGWWYDIGEMSREIDDDNVCDSCEDDYLD